MITKVAETPAGTGYVAAPGRPYSRSGRRYTVDDWSAWVVTPDGQTVNLTLLRGCDSKDAAEARVQRWLEDNS